MGAIAVRASIPSLAAAWPEVSPPEITTRVRPAARMTASSTRPSPLPIRSLIASAEAPTFAMACRSAATAGSSGPAAL
jgi:hypothetical protein